MKCRKCRQPAVHHLRQHRLALCREHYLDWFVEQTRRTIVRYGMSFPGERILVAVSGGKDSLALWDVLWRLDFPADGLYINLGIRGEIPYSDQSQQSAEIFARERNLNLKIVQVEESYGKSIPQLAEQTRQGKDRPCAVCGTVKRHIMNQAARNGGYSVLMTAHNLDDEAAVLLGNSLNWNFDLLARQSPVLPGRDGLVRKAKPFCRFYERDTAAYTLLRGIAYIEEECPFSEGSQSLYYKDVLNRMEADRPGTKLQYYVTFLQARQQLFPNTNLEEATTAVHPCPSCGQPTSSAGICSFCRLVGTSLDN